MRLPLSLKDRQVLGLVRRNPWLLVPNEKVLNYLRYRLTPRTTEVDPARQTPFFVSLFVSMRCNLACPFCVVGSSLNPSSHQQYEMTVARCEQLLKHPLLRRTLYFMLTGGEPLLNKEIVDIVRLLKRNRCLVAVNTNGLLLERHGEELIAAGLDSMNLSLYPANIGRLRDALPRIASRTHVKVCKVIDAAMLEDPSPMAEAVELAAAAGCAGVYFSNVLAAEGAPVDQSSMVIYDDDERYLRVQQSLRRRFPSVAISFPAAAQRTARLRDCRIPWFWLGVDSLGETAVCCKLTRCEYGNLTRMSPAELMNTELRRAIREGLVAPDGEVHPACRDCYLLSDSYVSDF